MPFRATHSFAAGLIALAIASAPTAAYADGDVLDQIDIPDDVAITTEFRSHLNTMSLSEAQEFVDTYLPATTVETVSDVEPVDAAARQSAAKAASAGVEVSASSDGCWLGKTTKTSKSSVGISIYKVVHHGRWCVSGKKVTRASVKYSDGVPLLAGWRSGGRIDEWSGVVNNQGRSSTQWKFIFGTGPADLVTATKCARVAGLYTATFRTSRDCGIY